MTMRAKTASWGDNRAREVSLASASPAGAGPLGPQAAEHHGGGDSLTSEEIERAADEGVRVFLGAYGW